MKRNKILAFFAAAVMAAGVLSGCGGNAGAAATLTAFGMAAVCVGKRFF